MQAQQFLENLLSSATQQVPAILAQLRIQQQSQNAEVSSLRCFADMRSCSVAQIDHFTFACPSSEVHLGRALAYRTLCYVVFRDLDYSWNRSENTMKKHSPRRTGSFSRRDATIAKAARDATAQAAAKDAEIARLQARVQQFEDAAVAMSVLSSSTEKRSPADVAAAAAAAGTAEGSSGGFCSARFSMSLQKSSSSSALAAVAASQKHKKRKVAHVEDSEVDDNNTMNSNTGMKTMNTSSKSSTNNAAITASGKKKASRLKTSGTANHH
eukprot:6082-Heterococcus_DN1.PRE.7